MLKKICVLTVSTLLMGASLIAQSRPAATSNPISISVGAEGSLFNPDWGCVSSSPFSCGSRQLEGVTALVDINHVRGKFGAEGEARWLHWGGPGGGLVESNYLLGPRFQALRFHKLTGDVKILLGGSWITLPNGLGNGSYFTIAPGATAGYRLTRRIQVRVDYEYQFWPSFSGIQGLPNNGLTPNGFSAGFTYRVWN